MNDLRSIVNNPHLYKQLKDYFQEEFKEYCVNQIRRNDDTSGLYGALKAIDTIFKKMEFDYTEKSFHNTNKVDNSV